MRGKTSRRQLDRARRGNLNTAKAALEVIDARVAYRINAAKVVPVTAALARRKNCMPLKQVRSLCLQALWSRCAEQVNAGVAQPDGDVSRNSLTAVISQTDEKTLFGRSVRMHALIERCIEIDGKPLTAHEFIEHRAKRLKQRRVGAAADCQIVSLRLVQHVAPLLVQVLAKLLTVE